MTGDRNTIIERHGQTIAALIPFADYIAVSDTLEDLRSARQAMPALEKWQADPSTARPWRELFTELMWIPFQTTNFRNDSEIGAKEFHLHA